MDLSKNERLILINQYRILEALYPDEADYYRERRVAFERGYSHDYGEAFDILYEEMSVEECDEVIDILNMYRVITFSLSGIDNANLRESDRLKFIGFDGNEESSQFGYAQWYINERGRFEELKYGKEQAYLNSHHPTLALYRAMLEEWKKSANKLKLTEADLSRLANVRLAYG